MLKDCEAYQMVFTLSPFGRKLIDSGFRFSLEMFSHFTPSYGALFQRSILMQGTLKYLYNS